MRMMSPGSQAITSTAVALFLALSGLAPGRSSGVPHPCTVFKTVTGDLGGAAGRRLKVHYCQRREQGEGGEASYRDGFFITAPHGNIVGSVLAPQRTTWRIRDPRQPLDRLWPVAGGALITLLVMHGARTMDFHVYRFAHGSSGPTAPEVRAAPVGRCGRASLAGEGCALCSVRLRVGSIREVGTWRGAADIDMSVMGTRRRLTVIASQPDRAQLPDVSVWNGIRFVAADKRFPDVLQAVGERWAQPVLAGSPLPPFWLFYRCSVAFQAFSAAGEPVRGRRVCRIALHRLETRQGIAAGIPGESPQYVDQRITGAQKKITHLLATGLP